MTDRFNMPGADAATEAYSSASRSLQTFSGEMQRMSKENFDATNQLMEKLRGAKTIEEVMSIQSTFMQQSFASYADYARRFSELMMALPMEMAKSGRNAFQQGSDAMTKATREAGDEIRKAGEHFNPTQG